MTLIAPTLFAAHVHAYIAAGFRLFPCNHPDNPKAPSRKHWRQTPYDALLEPETLQPIYGLNLQPTDLVIDVDPRRFTAGENQLKMLWEKLMLPPAETFIVSTVSGGAHIYFKKPADFPVRRRLDSLGFPAIEIKSAGQYVCGAGSVMPGGKIYSIERGSPKTIVDAPQELLDFIRRPDDHASEDDLASGITSDDKQTIERFIAWLMTPGVVLRGSYQIACEGRDYGLSKGAIFSAMRDYYNPQRAEPKSDDELKTKIKNAFAFAQNSTPGKLHPSADFQRQGEDHVVAEEIAKIKWDLKPNGVLEATITNCINFFQIPPHAAYENPLYGLIRYNQFTDHIEFTRPAPWHYQGEYPPHWTDTDTIQLKHWLGQNKHYNAMTGLYHEAVIAVSRIHQYHPIRDYLYSLKWDGVRRLDQILVRYAGAPNNDYIQEVGKNTLIAACARVMKPGCQHDHMLVLEGKQGSGKTSFVRTLGGKWFADVLIDPHSKDTVHAMIGSWFLEASEMEFAKRADVQALKAFLTRTVDKVRLVYHRIPMLIPRQSVFIGTVNTSATGYLRDTTGNRRYWCVVTGTIDIPALERDRDQLFAEAFQRYLEGENWHIIDPYIQKIALQEADARIEMDSWVEILEDWLGRNEAVLPHPLKTEYIAYAALNLNPSRLDRVSHNRLHSAMRELGWVRMKNWDKNVKNQVWSWEKPVDLSDL